MSEDIEISVEVRRATALAILVFDGRQEVWIPKSQIADYVGKDVEHAETVFIPEWLAKEKGLI